jgi:hypothetical protein
MTTTARKIEQEIQQLPVEDMIMLHELLIVSISEKEDAQPLDSAFKNEIQRRVKEIDCAVRFKQRVAEGPHVIAANPERFPPVRDLLEVQKLRIKQFPFTLLYINRQDYVWIVAVAHGSRKPGCWKKRIP